MTNINQKVAYISKEEKNGITQELVKSIFDYKDGRLYWKIKSANNTKIGNLAGYIHNRIIKGDRYIIKIKAKVFVGARIIFLWHHGYLPEVVDHKDRNKLNDKIENLRAATKYENARNRTSAKGSSSKHLGVHYQVKDDIWIVNIKINGKQTYLGCFNDENEAAKVYNEAAKIHYGEFANLNIIKP